MTVEYASVVGDDGEVLDDARVEVVGAAEQPVEPDRLVAAFHVDCHKEIEAERDDANEWRPR